jgi:hypothetical protein
MSRRQYGTRFTTGCGHSWRRRYSTLTVDILAGCTTNCPQCGEMLIIPAGQFKIGHLGVPRDVHMPKFHKYLHQQDPAWPEDGAGTGYVEFDLDGDEYVMHGKDAG